MSVVCSPEGATNQIRVRRAILKKDFLASQRTEMVA